MRAVLALAGLTLLSLRRTGPQTIGKDSQSSRREPTAICGHLLLDTLAIIDRREARNVTVPKRCVYLVEHRQHIWSTKAMEC